VIQLGKKPLADARQQRLIIGVATRKDEAEARMEN
jgi:hypothetical protein